MQQKNAKSAKKDYKVAKHDKNLQKVAKHDILCINKNIQMMRCFMNLENSPGMRPGGDKLRKPLPLNRIKSLRLSEGLTQTELASAVGVTKTTVSRWETGDIRNLKSEKIDSLCKVLRTNPGYLMGWNESLKDDREPELDAALSKLTDEEKDSVLNYCNFLLSQRKAKKA